MENKKDLKFIFFALMAWGDGISGGDKISIEFARHWVRSYPVTVYLWEEGYRMYLRQRLNPKEIMFQIVNMKPWKNFGFLINYIARIITGIFIALTVKLENNKNTVVYSATEFWMDSLPGLVAKLRFPNITWIATWFQTAPNPLAGFREGDRTLTYRFSAVVYWLVQLPIKPLIKKWADFVLVNNENEKKQFPEMNKKNKVVVALGAVDLELIKQLAPEIHNKKKIYDAVFQGRFHPQKGVVELIDIWKLVVNKKPDAKLVLIGDGPLKKNVELRIKDLGLGKNVILAGYLFDGEEKYKVFSQSKVAVHPAFYDSGGMATAEAMAWGLPAVGFNLRSFKSYYPKGMIKVPLNDLSAFAETILELLENRGLYSKMADEAKDMISQNWSWNYRAEEVLELIK